MYNADVDDDYGLFYELLNTEAVSTSALPALRTPRRHTHHKFAGLE